jgi:DNA-binding NarL/FixJ family response regulator
MAHLPNLSSLPNPDRLRVLAADSTPMSTQLLVDALARDGQFHMIESPCTEERVLSLIKSERPHVVLISARLGENGGSESFDLVRSVRALRPAPQVVVMIDSSERAAVVESFRAGARGVFCRTEPFRLLAKCIECVYSGQVWAKNSELHFLLEALAQPTFANFCGSDSRLSPREREVVRCVAEGLTNRQIAQRLKLTEHTVKNYLFRIFDKLELSSRVEVVLYAFGNGVPRASAQSENRGRSQPVAVTPRPPAIPVPIRKTVT